MSGNKSSSAIFPLTAQKIMALILLSFIAPIILAKLALSFSLFTPGVANKGQWLTQEMKILPNEVLTHHWHLVYVQPMDCKANCEVAFYGLEQLYKGLGAKQSQLDMLVIGDKPSPKLAQFSLLTWQSIGGVLAELQGRILLVNKSGIAILAYPAPENGQEMLTIDKDIKADFQRLMAFDRGNL